MILMALAAGAAYAWGVFYDGISDYKGYYIFDVIDTTFSLYLFPLSYFYFKSLSGPGWLGWKEVLWLIPGGVIGIISLILYLAMGESNAAGYIKESFENSGHLEIYTAPIYRIHFFVNIILYYIVMSAQVLVTLVMGTIQLITPRGFLRIFFNQSASLIMRKNRVVLICLWILLIIFLTAFLGEYYLSFDFDGIAHYVMALAGLIFFYLGYNIYYQTAANVHVSTEKAKEETDDTPHTTNATGVQLEILERFNALVDEEFYLRRNLRVEDVADMLHTNRTYVSKLLKEEFGCSFTEFISNKRIEYARELMSTHPHLTQEQIAEMTGFTHASSFSRAFKQHTGLTFREAQK